MQFRSGELEQTALRLAATTALSELAHFRFRVVQAIEDAVNVPAFGQNFREHFALKCLENRGLQAPLGDTRLVRHDGGLQAHVVQQSDRFWDTWKQFELGTLERRVNDASVLVIYEGVDHTVAVQ